MLLSFFYALRAFKIPVGTQEWLTLMKALIENVAESSLDRFYFLARSLLVKTESQFDAYDQAFLLCFKDLDINIDFKKEIYDWLNKSVDPKMRLEIPQIPPLTLEELRKKLEERLKEQTEEHHGGDHWIGTGGRSPFGNGGAHPSGIRIGGPGGGRMAVKVAEERRFQNLREDRTLDIRQFKVALKRLRKLEQVGAKDQIALNETIDATCKNAGEIELIFEAARKNQTELLLLMDIGGSMDPYVELMESLFSAAHQVKHFKSFHHYYFHNCPYSKLFTNMERNEWIPTEDLFKKLSSNVCVIVVGDACMNPYELFSPGGAIDYWEHNSITGQEWLKKIKQHFPKMVWLNPEPETFWDHVTIASVRKSIKMYSLTLEGLTLAINDLRKGGSPIKNALANPMPNCLL